ncbi:MAG: hypothetical protein MK102_13225 [Fuerstiella sp.]|nr:hypothetical protein [Fuerstiella sp.]
MQSVVRLDDVNSRCIQLIRERCGVVIHELQVVLRESDLQITGVIGSWHGKQLASEAARSLFPDRLIINQLEVVRPR